MRIAQTPRNLILLAFLFFVIGGLAAVLPAMHIAPGDYQEYKYYKTALEMRSSGDFLVPRFEGVPRLEKPPLVYWLVAATTKLADNNIFAYRLPSVIACGLTTAAVALIGTLWGGAWCGAMAALILLSCGSFLDNASSILPDGLLTAATTWWFACEVLAVKYPVRARAWTAMGIVCLSLAYLSKGPVAALAPMGCWAWCRWRLGGNAPSGRRVAWMNAIAVLPVLAWLLLVAANLGGSALESVWREARLHSSGATKAGRWTDRFSYAKDLFVRCLPWSVLLIASRIPRLGARGGDEMPEGARIRRQLEGWALLYLLGFTFLFGFRVRLRLILPLLPAMALLVAWELRRWRELRGFRKAGTLAGLVSLVFSLLALLGVEQIDDSVGAAPGLWVGAGLAVLASALLLLAAQGRHLGARLGIIALVGTASLLVFNLSDCSEGTFSLGAKRLRSNAAKVRRVAHRDERVYFVASPRLGDDTKAMTTTGQQLSEYPRLDLAVGANRSIDIVTRLDDPAIRPPCMVLCIERDFLDLSRDERARWDHVDEFIMGTDEQVVLQRFTWVSRLFSGKRLKNPGRGERVLMLRPLEGEDQRPETSNPVGTRPGS